MNPLLPLLQALEVELHHPGVRCDRARLLALLHPDFHEVGRSGRTYDRDTVIEALLQERDMPAVVSDAFAVATLAPSVALLSYRSADLQPDGGRTRHALRSSLWLLGPQGWQLRHHQGTPAAQAW